MCGRSEQTQLCVACAAGWLVIELLFLFFKEKIKTHNFILKLYSN